MNRTEMIKWLSENTNREQWVYRSKLQGDNKDWITGRDEGEICIFNIDDISVRNITIDDVFEPEQPTYIDGAVYEIGLMNKEPQQFIYNCELNMFERGTNESIGASSIHDSRVVTHFKLVSEPERITDREAIDTIRREEAAEFMDSSGVILNTGGLLNCKHSEPVGTITSSEVTDKGLNITIKANPDYPLFKPTYSAVSMLNEAAECIGDRAAERDTDSERSMLATVNAFNAMYGTELTETQGWMFQVFLKASRAKNGDFREDDYIDGASYFALAGECDGNVRR
ncbi:phosphofructokinase [Vibrio phage 159E36-2a]